MTRHRISLAAPAGEFHDGFPLGNGSLGAMLHGRPGLEWIDLNADTFWSGGPLRPSSGPAPEVLPALRKAVAEGDHVAADRLARRLQGDAWTQSFQPLGGLEWVYADAEDVSGYHRHLDLADAVAVTDYATASGPVRLTAFVSAPDGVLVVSVTGPGSLAAAVPPVLHTPHPATTGVVDAGAGPCLLWTGRAPAHVLPNYVDRTPAVAYNAAGMGFAVAVAVRHSAHETRLIVAAATGFRGPEEAFADLPAVAGEALARVAQALAVPTAKLLQRHVADHRALFDRADLALPGAERAELLFHLGRYLLIAGSRPGTQPANLQGLWNADVRPGWCGNWTTNVNAQMNYWAAEPTGLPELHEPLLTLTRDLAASGAATAARYYSARGAAAHHNTDLWRFTAPVPGDPQWANWPSALLWLSAHVWDHLEFGAGAGFAREVALPVLRAAAEFTLDMLVPDPSGALVFSPSTSPEHDFVTAGGGHTAVSWGCALDQELAREVLTRLLVLLDRWPDPALAALGVEAAAALAALRPVQIGPDGSLLEWYDDRQPREPGHRHLSHLYGLYPGTRITESSPDFEAARRALRTRLASGTGHTGWSRTWVLCLAARLRDPDLAEQSLTALADGLCSASLLTLHPDAARPSGQIFQIDGNLGIPAGITELLVQSHAGVLSLLPALPSSWPAGHICGIRCRGGHRVDVSWTGGRLASARIVAGTTGPLTVELPSSATVTVLAPDATIVPGAPPDRRRIRWQAHAATEYLVS
ncbi:glycoside hydrolase N-terminal domain-containing protein [Dactylosporangium siamense]|uniref:Alpha/beta hydrolase n=1 Tax=Dactylosporangium siamense TaxID=685454 RepID=A0A919UES0_9ACTN|nr:glycoside hydrolase family 95 protein [Dactylosporangium siamense]GIG48925.1 alpha/beta hydrolase [Dactylosporangium siamense]